jgi:hypothetical protein
MGKFTQFQYPKIFRKVDRIREPLSSRDVPFGAGFVTGRTSQLEPHLAP